MTIEERVSKLEEKWGKTDPLVRELRDAVTVTAELENRQGKLVREHSENIVQHELWLKQHEASMKEHNAAMKEHSAAMKELDKRIADLVSGFGAFIAGKPHSKREEQP